MLVNMRSVQSSCSRIGPRLRTIHRFDLIFLVSETVVLFVLVSWCSPPMSVLQHFITQSENTSPRGFLKNRGHCLDLLVTASPLINQRIHSETFGSDSASWKSLRNTDALWPRAQGPRARPKSRGEKTCLWSGGGTIRRTDDKPERSVQNQTTSVRSSNINLINQAWETFIQIHATLVKECLREMIMSIKRGR